MLIAENIHKTYTNGAKELAVLKGINLNIEKAQFMAIVGPSGAGKSTLLHILGGLDAPTKGRVVFQDTEIYKLNDAGLARMRNEKIGFVFQFYHLFSEFNVLENVLLPSLCGRKKNRAIRQKAIELLERIGLKERLAHMPNQLSGGEQQRVALARALINEPEILFCDEPTGNLDSQSGAEVMHILKDLNRQKGTSIVLVTHNEEMAKIAEIILHLKDGLLMH